MTVSHKYDVSDGNFPKQLSVGGWVEHHMTRVPVTRVCQRFCPWQLSTCHLLGQTKINYIKKKNTEQNKASGLITICTMILAAMSCQMWLHPNADTFLTFSHKLVWADLDDFFFINLRSWLMSMESSAGEGSFSGKVFETVKKITDTYYLLLLSYSGMTIVTIKR